jgi:glyoxylase-like metal-dependent hydrolase (beta-lactamase superfamily II)
VIRGPFNRCAPNGCSGAYGDDGMLHEAGDVAVRLTPEGLILVDDKYQNNVTEILEKVKSVSSQPVRYILNTHHHTDHAGGGTRRSSTRPRSLRTATCARIFCATSSPARRA